MLELKDASYVNTPLKMFNLCLVNPKNPNYTGLL